MEDQVNENEQAPAEQEEAAPAKEAAVKGEEWGVHMVIPTSNVWLVKKVGDSASALPVVAWALLGDKSVAPVVAGPYGAAPLLLSEDGSDGVLYYGDKPNDTGAARALEASHK
jgi:hypothetical protein